MNIYRYIRTTTSSSASRSSRRARSTRTKSSPSSATSWYPGPVRFVPGVARVTSAWYQVPSG